MTEKRRTFPNGKLFLLLFGWMVTAGPVASYGEPPLVAALIVFMLTAAMLVAAAEILRRG